MSYLKDKFQSQGYLSREQLKKYAKNKKISYNLIKIILVDLGIKIYDIKPAEKRKQSSLENESCVLCGKQTKFKFDQKIEDRDYYVKGIGQLCSECYESL